MTSPTTAQRHESGAEYTGPATVLTVGDAPDRLAVHVQLRGAFQPIDGRFHWYGRLQASPEITAATGPGTTVVVSTPHGEATGRLSDLDAWGRLRVTGVGQPPF